MTFDHRPDPPTVPRRTFLAGAGALSAGLVTRAGRGPTLLGRAQRTSPVKQIIVSCQENHSFDNYLGSYAALPAGYGIPQGWSQLRPAAVPLPHRAGDGVDPNHDWTATHRAYAGGRMNGFVSNGNGRYAMGYYTAADIPYYYSLLPQFTLCAEYFCGVLSETLPNRMVLYAGTSGGITENVNLRNFSLTWPCITQLLDDAGVTYKNYNFHASRYYSVPVHVEGHQGVGDEPDARPVLLRLRQRQLPQVTWIEKQTPWDEHPPADIRQGETMMEQIIKAVQAGPQWDSTVILHTYDEGGGYFDHRPPRELDAFGSGIRVPMIVISPLAKPGYVDTTYSDHASVLKFIEYVFGLPRWRHQPRIRPVDSARGRPGSRAPIPASRRQPGHQRPDPVLRRRGIGALA